MIYGIAFGAKYLNLKLVFTTSSSNKKHCVCHVRSPIKSTTAVPNIGGTLFLSCLLLNLKLIFIQFLFLIILLNKSSGNSFGF